MPKTKVYESKKPNWRSNTSNTEAQFSDTLLRIELANARKSKHITQKQLSELCGLSESCISNIENPNSTSSPTMRSLIAYATAIGVELYINYEPKQNKDVQEG